MVGLLHKVCRLNFSRPWTMVTMVTSKGNTNGGEDWPKVAFHSGDSLVSAEAGHTVEQITTIED